MIFTQVAPAATRPEWRSRGPFEIAEGERGLGSAPARR